MKVLLVTGSYPPMKCGVGDYTSNLANALASMPKMSIGVLTSISAEQENSADGVEIFPLIEKWRFAEIVKVVKVIRRWAPDIVHFQYPTQGYQNGLLLWIVPMLSFFMSKKVVQTWHEGFSRRDALKFFLISMIPGRLLVVRPQYREKILHPFFRRVLWKKEPLYIRNASSIPRVVLGQQEKEKIKKCYLKKQKRLIVFFGFVYPYKRIELLFQIANPDTDQIVIAGVIDRDGDYCRKIMRCASAESWQGKVTITGFLSMVEAAELLVAADAVILPFKDGGGEWNTSIHGVILNGTFAITTSQTRNGYDEKMNVYYAKIEDIGEMKSALAAYAGIKRNYDKDIDADQWRMIACEHKTLYEGLMFSKSKQVVC